MSLTTNHRRTLSLGCLAAGLLASTVSTAFAQQRLTAPVAPEGSARMIGMGSAVVALGGDAGAVAVNPATVTSIGPLGGDDFTGAGGALGSDFFAAHEFAQTRQEIPGSVWAAALNGPAGREQLLAYTTGSSEANGLDLGGTLRYEHWERQGDTNYRFDGDLGLRYRATNDFALGLSALNLLHPDPFGGRNGGLRVETQVIGGIGYSGHDGRIEGDYVYTQDHRYGRVGGELQVRPNFWVRTGVSDHDVTVGASVTHGDSALSLAVDFLHKQHTLFLGGVSSRF